MSITGELNGTDLSTLGNDAGTFYDRIARLHTLVFKFNGYGRSLERYFRENPLPLSTGARILDAGCGTGLLTLALLRALNRPVRITALDLSASSLLVARHDIKEEDTKKRHEVWFTQANVLALPFPDHTFELVVTSGVLEYVPLREGMSELARVLVPGGYLIHLPVRPSPVGKLLEVLYRFKAHPPHEVEESTNHHFRILIRYHFPPFDPIGWSKIAVLAVKS